MDLLKIMETSPPFESSFDNSMELSRLEVAVRMLERDSAVKHMEIIKLERSLKKLQAYNKNRRQGSIEGKPRLFSSTTGFSKRAARPNASSSRPESSSSMPGTSTTYSSHSSRTGPPPTALFGHDSPPNLPIINPQNPSSGLGLSFQDDPWATLNGMSFEVDSDLATILTELRGAAVDRLNQWLPIVPEIVSKKTAVVEWITNADNMHNYKTLQMPFSTDSTSAWSRLVHGLFPGSTNPASLITSFENASTSPQFFGTLVQLVVNAHERYCKQCELDPNFEYIFSF